MAIMSHIRPLDCISYPVYPMMQYSRNHRKAVIGLLVHKSCPYWQEISLNKVLLHQIKEFWTIELQKIQKNDIKAWFGHKRNYWLDKNVIKIIDS